MGYDIIQCLDLRMTRILTRHSNDMEYDQNISARLNTGIWRGGIQLTNTMK